MHTPASPRRLPLLAGAAVVLVAAVACAPGATGPGWTFAPLGPTPVPATPTPDATPGEPVGELIELQMQGIRFVRDGQPLTELQLTLGQEYTFRVDNLDGFAHDIFFGPPDQLAAWDETGLPGHAEWDSGVREFNWTPTDEAQGWQFACTVPGHYQSGMVGDLVLQEE